MCNRPYFRVCSEQAKRRFGVRPEAARVQLGMEKVDKRVAELAPGALAARMDQIARRGAVFL